MAIKYIPYFPNTLEGQAILDNFIRTKRVLRYRDNDRTTERIERGMPLYETELQERVGNNESGNLILRGRMLVGMRIPKRQRSHGGLSIYRSTICQRRGLCKEGIPPAVTPRLQKRLVKLKANWI